MQQTCEEERRARAPRVRRERRAAGASRRSRCRSSSSSRSRSSSRVVWAAQRAAGRLRHARRSGLPSWAAFAPSPAAELRAEVSGKTCKLSEDDDDDESQVSGRRREEVCVGRGNAARQKRRRTRRFMLRRCFRTVSFTSACHSIPPPLCIHVCIPAHVQHATPPHPRRVWVCSTILTVMLTVHGMRHAGACPRSGQSALAAHALRTRRRRGGGAGERWRRKGAFLA